MAENKKDGSDVDFSMTTFYASICYFSQEIKMSMKLLAMCMMTLMPVAASIAENLQFFTTPSMFCILCVDQLLNFWTTFCLLKLESLNYSLVKTVWSCVCRYWNSDTTWWTDGRTWRCLPGATEGWALSPREVFFCKEPDAYKADDICWELTIKDYNLLHLLGYLLTLTLWHSLLPYRYSYKASCVRPG